MPDGALSELDLSKLKTEIARILKNRSIFE